MPNKTLFNTIKHKSGDLLTRLLLRLKSIRREYLYAGSVILLIISVVGIYIVLTGKFRSNDLSKGSLIVNTNKAVYSLQEKVEISLASLDEKGGTLCNSKLLLMVTSPSGKKTELSTTKSSIITTSTCSTDNNVTNDPDYRAEFIPSEKGKYTIRLTNLDSKRSVENNFSVKEGEKIVISRTGASRLNPSKADRYPMIIAVTSKEDFKGQVVERIPSSFNVIWNGPAKVETVGEHKTLTWDVNLKAGETKELIYEYISPSASQHFYTLGSLKVIKDGSQVYVEERVWQLVNNITI